MDSKQFVKELDDLHDQFVKLRVQWAQGLISQEQLVGALVEAAAALYDVVQDNVRPEPRGLPDNAGKWWRDELTDGERVAALNAIAEFKKANGGR